VEWIIFAMLDVNDGSQTLSDFLARREDIVRNTRVIVFAYNAPYYLDSTEISKLTAYFGVYSKIDVFIDASVRALFQELPLNGASPVNVEGINYSLFRQTQPDPDQVIELFIVEGGETQSPPSAEPLETSVGDTLHLQTGIILDHNGKPVPDGTLVQLIQRDLVQGLENIIAEAPTTNGVAQLDYLLEARAGPGQFLLTAVSGEAKQSEEVDIIIEGTVAAAAIFSPTPAPTSTATASPTATATPSPTTTPTPQEPTGTPIAVVAPPQEPGIRIELSEFQMLTAVMLGLLLTGTIGLTFSRRQQANLDQQVAWPLWGMVGGLFVYNYFALGLPGTAMLTDLGSWAGLVTTIGGGFAGLVIYRLRQWA
jgi:beta-N-acetylhexosaminidase